MSNGVSAARLAGILYFCLVLTGVYNLVYVPSQTIVTGDPQQTLEAILANTELFKSGLAVGLISYLFYLALPIVLWRPLAPKGETWAALMVAFVVVSIPLAYLAIGEKLAILPLLEGVGESGPEGQALIAEEVYQLLRSSSRTMQLASIFWGLWLFPLGLLAWRARLVPRVLAALLILGCFGYLADYFGPLLVANYAELPFVDLVGKPASLAEIGTCLWLLIMGDWSMRRQLKN